MTKHCYRCKTVKDGSEFSKNSTRRDGLQGYCKKCKKEADRANYLKDPQRKYRENSAHKRSIKLKVLDYLLNHPCVDCGEADPIFLEFDHVRGKKLCHVSNLIHQTRAWSTIETEIAKCVVRCIKCHRIKTARQFGWYRLIERAKSSGLATS